MSIDAEKLEDALCAYDYAGEFGHLGVLIAAARAHLATLPRTKSVDRWAVTYWSLTHQTTVCRMAADEDDADRIVEGNGITACKHLLKTKERPA